jgi:ATP-dependent Clp protease ATP-binding subunit ClpA
MQGALDKLDLRLATLSESIATAHRQLDDLKLELEENRHRMAEQNSTLQQNITAVSDKMEAEVMRIRQFISETAEELRSVHAQGAEQQSVALSLLREQISAKLSLLQNSKVDRTAMALLLNELALQLSSSDKSDPFETTITHE